MERFPSHFHVVILWFEVYVATVFAIFSILWTLYARHNIVEAVYHDIYTKVYYKRNI